MCCNGGGARSKPAFGRRTSTLRYCSQKCTQPPLHFYRTIYSWQLGAFVKQLVWAVYLQRAVLVKRKSFLYSIQSIYYCSHRVIGMGLFSPSYSHRCKWLDLWFVEPVNCYCLVSTKFRKFCYCCVCVNFLRWYGVRRTTWKSTYFF